MRETTEPSREDLEVAQVVSEVAQVVLEAKEILGVKEISVDKVISEVKEISEDVPVDLEANKEDSEVATQPTWQAFLEFVQLGVLMQVLVPVMLSMPKPNLGPNSSSKFDDFKSKSTVFKT